jgi:hypothetical protein
MISCAVYGSSPLSMGVYSYIFDSAYAFLGPLAGGSPAASHFLLLRQKKSNQRKGDPTVCVPSLRYGQPAVLGPAGVSCKLASLKQARSLIRLALRSSAHTEGLWGHENQSQKSEVRKPQAPALARTCLYLSFLDIRYLVSAPSPSWLGRGAQTQTDQGSRLFEPQASLRETPSESSTAGCPKRSAGTQTAGRLFFGLLFFWRSKRKVTSRRATPGQQALARQQSPRTNSTLQAGAEK